MKTESAILDLPLRIGVPEDFAPVAAALREAAFDEATVCRTLKIPDMSKVGAVEPEKADLASLSDRLALFINLFLFLKFVPRAEVERALDRPTLDAFLKLDLLRIGAPHGERYYAPAFLYPIAGFLIASDLYKSRDNSPFQPPPDVVFPAIYEGTLRFLRVISKGPATAAIDLGTGAGIGALALSRNARHVVASDITTRATHFAEFNRLLNHCENVEVVCGDLYGAVKGRTFDRIVAHPPYMPSLHDTVIWRDGGATGENLVRRIITELPQYLQEGGTFYIVCLGLDTRGGRFEERARRWLGESQDEFDIIFAFGKDVSPRRVAEAVVAKEPDADPSTIGRLERAFEEAGTIRLVYGTLVMRRRAGRDGQPWTARTRLSEETEGSDFERAFDWRRQRTRPDFLTRLTDSKPRLAPGLRVKVTHIVLEGTLVPADFILETDKPFLCETRFDGWVIPLIAEFNGERTLGEVYQIYKEAGAETAMPDTFGLHDFAELAAMLIERGYLILD